MDEQTVTIDAPPFPPPAPPPAEPSRPWYERPVSRDSDDRKLGGVISGLCRTFGFDLRTTRLAVVIATIVLPVLVVAYIAAWVLLPARPEDAASLEAIVRDRRRVPLYIAIGLVLVAGGVGSFGSWFFFGGLPWGLGLIAVGVLLWAAPSFGRAGSSGTGTSASTTSVTPPAPTGSFGPPAADDFTSSTGTRPLQMADLRPKRRRVPVASLVTLAVLAFIGIAAAGDALDWWDIPVLTVVVVALVTTIVGVIVSAIVNRSWLGLPLVALLGVITVGLLIAQPDLDGGVGDRSISPASVDGAERPQQLGIGQLTIDLDQVPLGDDPVDVRAEVGIGHLQVIVPHDATVIIDAEVGAGDVVVEGVTVADGVRNSSDERTLQPEGASAGTITLDLEIGAGRIDVERAL